MPRKFPVSCGLLFERRHFSVQLHFQCTTQNPLFINTAGAFSSLEEVVVQKPSPLITLGRERVKPVIMISQGKQKCVASSAGSLTMIEVLCSYGKLPLLTVSGVLCSVLSLFPAPRCIRGFHTCGVLTGQSPLNVPGSVLWGRTGGGSPAEGWGWSLGPGYLSLAKVPCSHPGHTHSHPACLFQHRAFVLFWLLIQPEATGVYLSPQSSTRSSTQRISIIWKQK